VRGVRFESRRGQRRPFPVANGFGVRRRDRARVGRTAKEPRGGYRDGRFEPFLSVRKVRGRFLLFPGVRLGRLAATQETVRRGPTRVRGPGWDGVRRHKSRVRARGASGDGEVLRVLADQGVSDE
jgi:hypothetical protein